MEMGTAIIVVSLVTTMGMLVSIFLIQYNWKNKQTFLLNLNRTKRLDSLKYKKLQREMGITPGNTPPSPPPPAGLDQLIAPAIQKYLSGDEETGEEGGLISQFVQDNPELVQGLLSKGSELLSKKNLIEEDIIR